MPGQRETAQLQDDPGRWGGTKTTPVLCYALVCDVRRCNLSSALPGNGGLMLGDSKATGGQHACDATKPKPGVAYWHSSLLCFWCCLFLACFLSLVLSSAWRSSVWRCLLSVWRCLLSSTRSHQLAIRIQESTVDARRLTRSRGKRAPPRCCG